MKPDLSGGSIPWHRYLLAFFIAASIFATAFYINYRLNNARINDIRNVTANVSTDILSLETQFDLLQEMPCDDVQKNSILPSELSNLGDRLAFAENELGAKNEQVVQLKKQYTLLEIKDYLLMRRIESQCKASPPIILYFYSNQNDCPDCQKQGYVLTQMLVDHPELRVYSFDYNLPLPALDTLESIYKLEAALPAIVVNRVPYYGFQDTDAILGIIPSLKATTTPAKALKATTTKAR
jgi:hypothetical protein